jgi:ABC-2 type transport system ATP-binding protein
MIHTDRLTKYYGETLAVADLDLHVEAGEILGFLGPNGAGKTTTVKILAGLIPATSGRAAVAGFDVASQPLEAKKRLGYVPETPKLYDALTADAFLDVIGALHHVDPTTGRRRRGELLGVLGLGEARYQRLREFSKGMRQKVVIAAALMHRPDVLILDEPTSGLDPLVQEEVARLLEEAAREGRTVFFSSHVLPEVERLSQAVAIIREGQIVAVEDIAKLKARSVHVVEVTFAVEPPRDLFALPGVRELRRDGNMVHLQARDGIDAVIKAIARYPVVDLRTEQPSLEDIFLAYYAGHADEEERRAVASA